MQSATVVNRRFRDFSRAKFAFEDNIFTTTSTTFVETGVSLVPEAGINVILFRANASAGSLGGAAASLQATYAGSEIGSSELNKSIQGGHWNSIEFAGFRVIDSDGTSEVKINAKVIGGARNVDVGAQQIISLPLEGWGLVEDTHYSFFQSEDTFQITSPTAVIVDSMAFTVPTTGKYLVLWYAESAMAQNAGLGEYAIYGFVNEGDSFNNRSSHIAREAPGTGSASDFHTWFFSEIRTIQAGANSYSVRSLRWQGNTIVSVRKPRMIVISLDAFQGTPKSGESFADVATTSNSFVEIPALSRTFESGSRSEQVLFIANCTGGQNTIEHPGGSDANVATYKIRDATAGVDYATDSGERLIDISSNRTRATTFGLKENASGSTVWQVFLREANNTGGWVTYTHGNSAVMGLTPKPNL